MILAIDLGNSNITFGCIDQQSGKIIFEERIHTDFKFTSIEYAVSFDSIFKLHQINPINLDGSILSSSAPSVTRQVINAIEIITKKSVIEVGPGIKTGLDIKIENPAQLGSDLLVGAVAGVAEYGYPLIIIDMGTATTLSVVNKDRKFIGGMILPGIKVSLNGLISNTGHLPDIAISNPGKLISGSTEGAMQSGLINGHASSIDGLVERIWNELDCVTPVVATGGFARTIIPCCDHECIIDSQLNMKGLYLLYIKNQHF